MATAAAPDRREAAEYYFTYIDQVDGTDIVGILDRQLEEFQAVRASTLEVFENLPPEAWARRGTASGCEFTVRALAFVTAGHVEHHARILRERYL
jgi:hypothetical protein